MFKLREKFDVFTMVCDYLLPGIVGRKHFKENRHRLPLSEIVTESDEAFFCLILENNSERWEDMVENNTMTSNKPTKWSKGKGKGALKFNGWEEKGLKRFNKYMKIVQDDREKRGADFDRYYKEHVKNTSKDPRPTGKKNNKVKMKVKNDLKGLNPKLFVDPIEGVARKLKVNVSSCSELSTLVPRTWE